MHQSLRDVLSSHPSYFMLVVAAWVPLCIWTALLVGWMIQGEIDTLLGIIMLFVCLIISIASVISTQDAIPFIAFFSYASLIIFPIAKSYVDRYELKLLDFDAVDQAYIALGGNPTNPALKFRLAKAAYNCGLIEIAIGIGEKALEKLPQNRYESEYLELKTWKYHLRKESKQKVICPSCGWEVNQGETFCQHCGRPYLALLSRGKWHNQNVMRRLLSVWAALAIVGFGTYYAFSIFELGIAIPITVVIIVFAIFSLIRGFDSSEIYA